MAALVIFGVRLLYLAVYVQAAVIVVLVVALLWARAQAAYSHELYEEAWEVCTEVRATLQAMQRMSTIRRHTAERMERVAGRGSS